jgi:hypothetical protein
VTHCSHVLTLSQIVNHGHSVTTMLTDYAAWIEGAKDAGIEAIKRAMESRAYASTIAPGHRPLHYPTVPRICQ